MDNIINLNNKPFYQNTIMYANIIIISLLSLYIFSKIFSYVEPSSKKMFSWDNPFIKILFLKKWPLDTKYIQSYHSFTSSNPMILQLLLIICWENENFEQWLDMPNGCRALGSWDPHVWMITILSKNWGLTCIMTN